MSGRVCIEQGIFDNSSLSTGVSILIPLSLPPLLVDIASYLIVSPASEFIIGT
jgi:hypothetical protein